MLPNMRKRSHVRFGFMIGATARVVTAFGYCMVRRPCGNFLNVNKVEDSVRPCAKPVTVGSHVLKLSTISVFLIQARGIINGFIPTFCLLRALPLLLLLGLGRLQTAHFMLRSSLPSLFLLI